MLNTFTLTTFFINILVPISYYRNVKILNTIYEGVSKRFRTESITKYTFTTVNTSWQATQRVMAAKLCRLTHKIAMQLHFVAESCLQAASPVTFGYTLVNMFFQRVSSLLS